MPFGSVYQNKRVFITGHTGFKGSWLALWLKKLGATVGGVSVDIPSTPSHFEIAALSTGLEDVRGDVRDYPMLLETLSRFRPDFVFHLAARPLVRDCYDHPLDAFSVNAMGTANVLEACRHVPSVKTCLIITTDKCYENVEWEYGYRENDRLGGKDPYSASKACAEIVYHSFFLSYLKNSSLKSASVRAGNVIGGGDWAQDRILPDAARAWSQSQALLVRNPEATRPWQHVIEPLSGYLHLAAKLYNGDEGVNGESFNFGPAQEGMKTVRELLTEIQKHWKGAWTHVPMNDGKKEARLLSLCCDKAYARLKWHGLLSFEETSQMTATWYDTFYRDRSKAHAMTLEQIADYETRARERGLEWAN